MSPLSPLRSPSLRTGVYQALPLVPGIVPFGLVTFAVRHSFVYLFGRVEAVPPRLATALRFVPPAVLAALVFPAPVGDGALVTDRTLAGAVAAVAAWYTGDTLATVVVGTGALWALRFLA